MFRLTHMHVRGQIGWSTSSCMTANLLPAATAASALSMAAAAARSLFAAAAAFCSSETRFPSVVSLARSTALAAAGSADASMICACKPQPQLSSAG